LFVGHTSPRSRNTFARAEEAAAVGYALTLKRAADGGEWRAAAWWLEHRRPEEWSLKRILLQLEKESGPIEPENESDVDLERRSTERLSQLREILLEARRDSNALPARKSALPDRSGS
jgi:hypothetical protein